MQVPWLRFPTVRPDKCVCVCVCVCVAPGFPPSFRLSSSPQKSRFYSLVDPSQLIIHQSSYHPTLYSPDTESLVNNTKTTNILVFVPFYVFLCSCPSYLYLWDAFQYTLFSLFEIIGSLSCIVYSYSFFTKNGMVYDHFLCCLTLINNIGLNRQINESKAARIYSDLRTIFVCDLSSYQIHVLYCYSK
jgi:hypothetical protein